MGMFIAVVETRRAASPVVPRLPVWGDGRVSGDAARRVSTAGTRCKDKEIIRRKEMGRKVCILFIVTVSCASQDVKERGMLVFLICFYFCCGCRNCPVAGVATTRLRVSQLPGCGCRNRWVIRKFLLRLRLRRSRRGWCRRSAGARCRYRGCSLWCEGF